MKAQDKIYVAGHNGMVGSAIVRCLERQGYTNIITRRHKDLSLADNDATESFFAEEKPDYVFLAAAKVGGILANNTLGGDFIRENLKIQTNTIESAHNNGVKKLLFLGSSCIYPKFAEQPIKEEALLTGALEQTNAPYAVAKIAGATMCDAYMKQYGFHAFTAMPCNVYGIKDNFDPMNSHVIAGLMRRIHEAKQNKIKEVIVWGSGKPLRELIDADDLADACVFLMQRYDQGGLINAGSSEEISIYDLALLIKEIVGFEGDLVFDSSKPDGTPRKLLDNSKIHSLGWRPKTNIKNGLTKMYSWYKEQLAG